MLKEPKNIIYVNLILAYLSAVANCLSFNFFNDDLNTGLMSALIFINFLVNIIFLYRIINLTKLKKSNDNYIYIIFMHSVLIVAQVLARNDVGFRPKELNFEVQATIFIAILWCLDILMLTLIFINLNSAIRTEVQVVAEQVENSQLFGSKVYYTNRV